MIWLRTSIAVLVFTAAPRAQQPTLDQALARLDAYLLEYETTLATVVAEERYVQVVSIQVGPASAIPAPAPVRERRVLLSDYALARSPGGHTWTGFRDTFEVDGKLVRDREQRLLALLAEGSPDSARQALRISRENARYNIGDEIALRTINVPTIALDLVHPRNRSRFTFRKTGEETIDGTPTWKIDYAERRRPTIIRTPDGKDQRARGSIWIDAATGEVRRTMLTWDGDPAGFVTVRYRPDDNVGTLVPAAMIEQYRRGRGTIDGEATYTNYRRFQTAVRIVR